MTAMGYNTRTTETAAHNIVYKTLGFKWLFKHSATHQVRCNWTGKKPAIPNDFIPPNVMPH